MPPPFDHRQPRQARSARQSVRATSNVRPLRALRQPRLRARLSNSSDKSRKNTDFNRTIIARLRELTGQVAVPIRSRAKCPVSRATIGVCGTCRSHTECSSHWLRDLVEIRGWWRPAWHRCPEGHWCGLVPVPGGSIGISACRLVCDRSMRRHEFLKYLEVLDLLVRGYVCTLSHSHVSSTSFPACQTAPAGSGQLGSADREPVHPRVSQAIEIIKKSLTDNNLSATSVARQLDTNPAYLGHLFRRQVGQRMSEFIGRQRIALAESLLRTTDWQIKRVAAETGHRRPDWFSQVFKRYTGLKPAEYRKIARRQEKGDSGS